MLRRMTASRRFLILAGAFAVFWIFLIFINLRSIDDHVGNIAMQEVHKNSNNVMESYKFNGAEMDLDAKIVVPQIKPNPNDDKALENMDQPGSAEAVNKSFPINPKLAEIVKEEIKWESKDIPDVNLTELSVISGQSEEVCLHI